MSRIPTRILGWAAKLLAVGVLLGSLVGKAGPAYDSWCLVELVRLWLTSRKQGGRNSRVPGAALSV